MNKVSSLLSPVVLNKNHNRTEFSCGYIELDNFLKNYALQNAKNNASRTFVSLCKLTKQVAGYYTLTYGSINHENATESVRKQMPRYPIPIMILARLAVSKDYKNIGLGKGLLKDAMIRSLQASDIAGLRAVIAHAKDDKAKNFYLKYGFEESELDKYHVMVTIQSIKKALEQED